MTPHYEDEHVTLHHGDCLDILRTLPDNSIDAVVTDPPYGLGFMGKDWDDLPPGLPWAQECLRVLKPGGHLLAFGGTRTWHRLAVAIEDAGFEIRDSIAWLYGSGFPKSLDVSKAIDKAAGAERASRNGQGDHDGTVDFGMKNRCPDCNLPYFSAKPCVCPRKDRIAVTAEAEQWQGWGTALKPAFEPIVVARKTLTGTVAANVLAHGTGALNIDACRIGTDGGTAKGTFPKGDSAGVYGDGINGACEIVDLGKGRWPANVTLDENAANILDQQSGNRPGMSSQRDLTTTTSAYFGADKYPGEREGYNDTGGASRFYYVAKAPKRERPIIDGVAHPTVKPLALMRWLIRLVTPPEGVILEPFAGSGTTIEAALLEHVRVIAIEREATYLPLILARISRQQTPPDTNDQLDMFGDDAA